MKKKYLYLLLAILMSVNLFFILKMMTGSNEISVNSYDPGREINMVTENLNHYLDLLVTNQVMTNSSIIDSNLLLITSDSSTVRLHELMNGNEALFANFQFSTCQICLSDEIALLGKMADEIGLERVILLYRFDTPRDRISFERNNGLLTYETTRKSISPVDSTGQPVLFVISEDYRIQDLFIPNKDLVGISESYYTNLLDKYF